MKTNNNTPTPKEWERELSNFLIEMWSDLIYRKNSVSIKDIKNYSEQYGKKRDKLFNLISTLLSQQKQELVEEIDKLESENWQDTYEAGYEDAKEAIINLLQNK